MCVCVCVCVCVCMYVCVCYATDAYAYNTSNKQIPPLPFCLLQFGIVKKSLESSRIPCGVERG